MVCRGIALYAHRRGADVTAVETDPVKALEAAMDGFDVDGADEAVRTADVVITATGRERVVGYELIETMRDGVLLANAGHTDAEIDVLRLEREGSWPDGGPVAGRSRVARRSYRVLAGPRAASSIWRPPGVPATPSRPWISGLPCRPGRWPLWQPPVASSDRVPSRCPS